MNSNNKIKKVNWRVKALLSILISIIVIVVLLFSITYIYFENKFENNTKKIAEATFKQADKELKNMLSTVEGEINRYGRLRLPFEYLKDEYKNEINNKRLVSRDRIRLIVFVLKTKPAYKRVLSFIFPL